MREAYGHGVPFYTSGYGAALIAIVEGKVPALVALLTKLSCIQWNWQPAPR
jgi:hypothetical protein